MHKKMRVRIIVGDRVYTDDDLIDYDLDYPSMDDQIVTRGQFVREEDGRIVTTDIQEARVNVGIDDDGESYLEYRCTVYSIGATP